jgi:hypothetical protein
MNTFTHKTTNLWPCCVAAAHALLEIETAVISVVSSVDMHLLQALHVSRNFVTSPCIVILFHAFLYVLLNASRTAAYDFDSMLQCEVQLGINSRSAPEYVMFAPPQLLRNYREQRPSSQGDLKSSATGKVGGGCYTEMDLPLTSFVYGGTWLFWWIRFKWYTLYYLYSTMQTKFIKTRKGSCLGQPDF